MHIAHIAQAWAMLRTHLHICMLGHALAIRPHMATMASAALIFVPSSIKRISFVRTLFGLILGSLDSVRHCGSCCGLSINRILKRQILTATAPTAAALAGLTAPSRRSATIRYLPAFLIGEKL